MILGMHHTAIATADIDKLSKFYCDVIGLRKIAEDGWANVPELDSIVGLKNSAARFMLLSAGNQLVELFEFSSPAGRPGDPNRPVNDQGFTHICFVVDDIDAEYERLVAAGMPFFAPPVKAGDRPLRATYGRDPDGNVVELLQIVGDTPFNYLPTTPRWRK